MRRILAIVFISIYAFSFTELHQLFKLPVLVEHYNEHQQINTDLTFFQFLVLHYSSESDRDSDYERDMELPFKDFGHCAAVQTVILPHAKIELKDKPTSVSTISFSSFYKKFIPSSHLSEIWQPPRI